MEQEPIMPAQSSALHVKMLQRSVSPGVTLGANNCPLWEAQILLPALLTAPRSRAAAWADLHQPLLAPGQEPHRDERLCKCHLSCFGNKPICHLSKKTSRKLEICQHSLEAATAQCSP